MFKPAKMAKIDLQVPQDHVAKTTQIIANLKIMHLMNVRKTRVGELDLESHADSNLLHKYTGLKGRVEKILTLLEIDPDDSMETTRCHGMRFARLQGSTASFSNAPPPDLPQLKTVNRYPLSVNGQRSTVNGQRSQPSQPDSQPALPQPSQPDSQPDSQIMETTRCHGMRFARLQGSVEAASCRFSLSEEMNPHKDIFQIDREVQQLEGEVDRLIGELNIPERARKEKEELLSQLEILSSAGVSIDQFRECRFLYVAAGLIPTDNLGRLEFSLSNMYHTIIPSVSINKQRLIFVFGSRRDREKIEKALKSAYFEKMEIPLLPEGTGGPLTVNRYPLCEMRDAIPSLPVPFCKVSTVNGNHSLPWYAVRSAARLDGQRSTVNANPPLSPPSEGRALDSNLDTRSLDTRSLERHSREGGNPDLCQGLRSQIRELEAEKSRIQSRLDKEKKQFALRLHHYRRKILLAIAVLEIGKSYDKVGGIYHISGWIPQKVVPSLEREVLAATDGQARIAVVSSNVMWQVGDLLKIPTCFQNPFLLRPFEKLVAEYGIPSYQEVEPTFFFALSFLFMFGVMFGDVGQGLILILLGLVAFKKSAKENVRDIGLIIMECGIMSAIFGFLYGSVFGFEHLMRPLWFSPLQHINYFMKITIFFGMGVISIGMILNIINSIKNNDYKGIIFGEFGIMGLVFYWGCIGLALSWLATGKLSGAGSGSGSAIGKLSIAGSGAVSAIGSGSNLVYASWRSYMLLILFLPLLVIFLKEPLLNLYGRVVLKKRHPILPERPVMYIMESLIEVGDTVIAFLSHTVSFVRVSAFALAHAGLFLAVFTLARTMQNLKGGTLWYWLTILLGNIVIIVVEGLVVSIQTIRLEYYEFFTKFFHGGGEIYKPLREI